MDKTCMDLTLGELPTDGDWVDLMLFVISFCISNMKI